MRALLFVLAVFALVLAGCGDKDDGSACGPDVEKMKDKATDTVTKVKDTDVEFACAKPG